MQSCAVESDCSCDWLLRFANLLHVSLRWNLHFLKGSIKESMT